MNAQLLALVKARSDAQVKILHDQLRAIRGAMNERGIFTSSMHVNAAIRACSDYFETLASGATEDFKRAILVDKKNFSKDFLTCAQNDFLNMLIVERKNIENILEQNVGEIAKSLSNKGLQEYGAFDTQALSTLRKAQAEIEIFNAEMLEKIPSRWARLVKWVKENPLIGIPLAIISVLTPIYKFWEIVQALL
ncbi:MAG: hypothetical protein H7Z73_04675 [Candidatus Saccharibacteria bacterium]|nr:hypothetical protein [Moraxellaceae bacterium]